MPDLPHHEPALRRRTWVRYLLAIAGLNLVWEIAQMPLYTLWLTGTGWEIGYAIVHCTLGDVLIAASSLGLVLLGLMVLGLRPRDWPARRYVAVAGATMGVALGYTVFSEWWNVEVRQAWAYREIMPRLPGLGTGASPVLQWLMVPGVAFWVARPRAG